MWYPPGFPISLLGLAAQVPLEAPSKISQTTMAAVPDFAFKGNASTFTPEDLVALARPGTGLANPSGDLVLVPVSKYSLEEKKDHKSIFIASVESSMQPYEIPLTNGGEAFWLDARTVAHAVEEGEDKDKVTTLYALSVKYEIESRGVLSVSGPPVFIGKFPTSTPSNFKYTSSAGILVFSDYVHADGDLKAVKKNDEAWENRGDSAYGYDDTYERHWDTWVGPKRPSLFSVNLSPASDNKWILGQEFTNLLNGTGHNCPVEPFGGTDDFEVSDTHVIYTAKDPVLPAAWHTKQNVYIVDIIGQEKPKELTSGKHGATHSPVLNAKGDKAAWLQLDKDGAEADRAKIVIYDLVKDIEYTLTQCWDRSPDALAFSTDGEAIYFTAGDLARIKVFVLPLPETPSHSTPDPSLPPEYLNPVALTFTGAASGLQVIPNGRLIFTRSSLTSPNDVYVMRGLDNLNLHDMASRLSVEVEVEQITQFSTDALKSKNLDSGEDFWFEGAESKKVQGWLLKPPGFKKGDRKKWPVVVLIHGGPQGAWEDQWSTRWNPNVFAQQGYVTIAMNPTGSTTFGQEFTDAISEDWGGKPFVDMQKGWKYILDNYPEIDPERAVAAGASWGGYAINWIQGHPEYGFGFKALVCHDGVFSATYNGYSTDELFFFNNEWGGRPWEAKAKEILARYDPVNFVDKWSTPMLVIHGSKDYRLPETDGIGAFHTLQEQGIPSRLLIFPDENHWVLKHQNSLKWHYEVFRWFDKYLKEDD
ncbi:alpha/beta-hydrolase [Laetiporus sulphureus 93-53]|uniref:Dipeptidyl-peptidase V n=1 Tax=Laetiporus sulphureus 93-53 TaxID=1314785 RepID=A0A165HLT6_9APHY|nr:alpha/beta-hydrolase [Laetiporus sulphureus 93-53]KZT11901.1 alpha/beta-hydrolase [Laetiporus sulphureus 93-53]